MITFAILLIIAAILATFILLIAGVIGGATLVVFGDLIACVIIIWLIVKLFKKIKK